MLEVILYALAALVLGLIVYVATRPAEFVIERSARMAAAPADVFAQVNDFYKWQHWSPWAALDPNAKAIFGERTAGEGATFAWDGNRNVGAGKMTIVESAPNDRIQMRLEFEKPMKGTNKTLFTFAPAGEATRMTWRMEGRNNFVGRAFCLFMDMDKVVGGQFEQGMENIDRITRAVG